MSDDDEVEMKEKDLDAYYEKEGETVEGLKAKLTMAEANSHMYSRDLFEACGWMGGTIHQVISEIKRLKTVESCAKKLLFFAEAESCACQHHDETRDDMDDRIEMLREGLQEQWKELQKMLGAKNAS